jgi:hypothetical protein
MCCWQPTPTSRVHSGSVCPTTIDLSILLTNHLVCLTVHFSASLPWLLSFHVLGKQWQHTYDRGP